MDVDIIDICTPPTLHVAQALAALAAGKHVICEKPIAGSLAEVDQLIAAEQAAPGRLMPIFQYRFGNGVQRAKRIVDLGPCRQAVSCDGRDRLEARRRLLRDALARPARHRARRRRCSPRRSIRMI